MQASCRLTQLRCWVVPGRDSSSSASSGRRVPSLHSKVEFNLAAIPPHLRRGEPRRKCSGRPGHGRPGRWRRLCQTSRLCVRCFAPATNPCCPPQTARFRPHQRCYVLHLFEGQCLFAKTVVPRSTVSAALTPLGRSGPGRGGRLPTHSAGLFRCSREPKVSLPRRSRARRPPLQDRLPGHAPLRSAPYGTGRLAGGSRIEVRGNAGQVSRPDASACKTSSTIGQPGTHARASVRHPPASPARRPEKGYKYILREAAADAAAGAIMLA